jgi:hypothetical protein
LRKTYPNAAIHVGYGRGLETISSLAHTAIHWVNFSRTTSGMCGLMGLMSFLT